MSLLETVLYGIRVKYEKPDYYYYFKKKLILCVRLTRLFFLKRCSLVFSAAILLGTSLCVSQVLDALDVWTIESRPGGAFFSTFGPLKPLDGF